VVAKLEGHEVVAIDTEFMIMPFYRPNLEVFQLSTPGIDGMMVAIDVQRLRSVLILFGLISSISFQLFFGLFRPQLGPLIKALNSKEVNEKTLSSLLTNKNITI
jgi:hypothetical protein